MERMIESDIKVLDVLYKQPGKVEVSKVQHKKTNQILCMKKIFVDNLMDATFIQNECLTMALLQHPYILSLRAASLGGQDRAITHVIIFMDYFEEGDLEKLIFTRIREASR